MKDTKQLATSHKEEDGLPVAEPLPPRRTVHPSEMEKLNRYFFRSLIIVFVSLTAGLIVWGSRFTAQ